MEDLINLLINSNLKLVSRETGIPYDRMYKWTRGEGRPKIEDFNKLTEYFYGKSSKKEDDGTMHESINPSDLIYKASNKKTTVIPDGLLPTTNRHKKGVPYYDVDFLGGFDLVYNDHTVQPAFYIDFLPFNDCDVWINVTGKSMGPLIAHGDIVALKYQRDWKKFLLEGEIYAIVTENGFRTIKILGSGPDKDHYMLIPYSKDEVYQPQPIPKNIITHVFRVKGNIKKFF